MSAVTRRRQPGGNGDQFAVLAVALTVLAGLALMWVAMKTAGTRPPGMFAIPTALAKHTTRWDQSCTIILIAEVTGLLGLAAAVLYWRRQLRQSTRASRSQPVDRAARYMGTGAALRPLSQRTAQRVAKHLGIDRPGLKLAYSVIGGAPLYLNWEQCALLIAGPRTMKTSAVAIPAILNAPGFVVVTTNKRDVIDATRGPRATRGDVRVFDPQAVVGEQPTWWFNMLGSVRDEQTAHALADVLAAAYRETGERRDPFFHQQGLMLLTGFLLALRLTGQPITHMIDWLTDQTDTEAVDILRQHRWNNLADIVSSIIQYTPRQRDGVYGTAINATAFLHSKQITAWITEADDDHPARRTELDIAKLVTDGTGTLYCVSQEGPGNAGPVVAALSVAVMQTAERLATMSPGGRLATPIVAVLDEAANVCRWPELPKVYSHYGSKGIILLTMLQSWSQGAEAWGGDNMDTMWSAANIKLYGGGSHDVEFLSKMSRLIGDYSYSQRSASYGRGQRSYNTSLVTEEILSVRDLAALPAGRVVVFATGAPPVLARTTPWMASKPIRDDVRASILQHDPAGRATVEQVTTVRP